MTPKKIRRTGRNRRVPTRRNPRTQNNSVSFVFAVVKDVLEIQRAQKDSLDTKASTLLAFAGGVFALLMGARDTIIQLSRLSQILIVTSVALFAISVVFATIAAWVRRYRADPNPEALAQKYVRLPETESKLQVTANLIGAWKSNLAIMEQKATFLRAAFVAQAIAFVLMGLALFLSVL